MNSHFNTVGRKSLSLGRPLDVEAEETFDLEPAYASDIAKEYATEEVDYDTCGCNGCTDKGNDESWNVRKDLTSVLSNYLKSFIENMESDLTTATALLDSEEQEANKPYENYLEIHGVTSFNVNGGDLSLILDSDADIFFNDVLAEDGKIDHLVNGAVHVFMVGENTDTDMDLYFENTAHIFSTGPYNFGSIGHDTVKFHTLSVRKVCETKADAGASLQQMSFGFNEASVLNPGVNLPVQAMTQASQSSMSVKVWDHVAPMTKTINQWSEAAAHQDFVSAKYEDSIASLNKYIDTQVQDELIRMASIGNEPLGTIGKATSGVVHAYEYKKEDQAKPALMGYAGMLQGANMVGEGTISNAHPNDQVKASINSYTDSLNKPGMVHSFLKNVS